MNFKKDDLVRLKDGKDVKIINLPNTFMANGSYEVIEWLSNGIGSIGNSFWVSPEQIFYHIKEDSIDDINNYFEVIWDEEGLNLIPKEFLSIDIESDREDFNRIKFNFDDGRKHDTVNIHVGDIQINDKDKITIRPKKKKKSKIEKIINVLKEEDEV